MKKLPVDILGLVNEITHLEEASKTSVFACLYIDETAPDNIQALTRAAFSSEATNARVAISYFPTMTPVAFPGADLAVVVAGANPDIGKIVTDLRGQGVATMTITATPSTVFATAKQAGYPLLEQDVIYPRVEPKLSVAQEIQALISKRKQEAQSLIDASAAQSVQPQSSDEAPATSLPQLQDSSSAQTFPAAAESQVLTEPPVEAGLTELPVTQEPLELTDDVKQGMQTRIGRWVIAAVHQKRFACSLAFPVVRRPLAQEMVVSSSLQNAGVGLVTIIPGSDMPLMTANQCKMLLQIAAAYGQPLSLERVKELLAIVGGGFTCRSVARSLVGVVPILGPVIKMLVGFGGTQAMGRAAIEYFEGNGRVETVIEKLLSSSKSAYHTYVTLSEQESFTQGSLDIASVALRRVLRAGAQSLAPFAIKLKRGRITKN